MEELRSFLLQPLNLDKSRILERCQVHFNCDLDAVPDITRIGIGLNDVKYLKKLINLTRGQQLRTGNAEIDQQEILEMENRFSSPSPLGYVDLRFRLSMPLPDGRTFDGTTFRVIHSGTFRTQWSTLHDTAIMNSLRASETKIRQDKWVALVCDNFNFDRSSWRTIISGFPDRATAIQYAHARTTDSVKRLLTLADGYDHFKTLWLMYGEEIVVCTPSAPKQIFCSSDDISSYFLERSLEEVGSWNDLSEEHKLTSIAMK